MKRFLPAIGVILSIFLVIGIFLVVVVVTRKSSSGPVVIRYVGLWDPEVVNPLKKEFQKSHPDIIIEYEQKDQGRYWSFLTKALGSKSPPDLFWWHSGWATRK